jgi:glycerol-3-phosphate dehydrogenase
MFTANVVRVITAISGVSMPASAVRIFNSISTTKVEHTSTILDKAAVLGGSVAGLIAARVLAYYAKTVVIIDRDDLDTTENSRPGVPQSSQVHTLLLGGLRQLERWYPGFASQGQREGAVMVS